MGSVPVQDRGDVREYQLNMDGQQVTSQLGPGGQPRFSRDAIAEFQFISNRFDATQGRSTGVQVNAVTRSGTNNFDGTFAGYFRNAEWGAEDPVLGVKVPLEEQQWSSTFGGPIMRDKSPLLRELRVRPAAEDRRSRTPRSRRSTSRWRARRARTSRRAASTTSCRRRTG